MEQVLLLNSNWEYHDTISWKRAIRLVVKNKVEVIKNTAVEIAPGFFVPKVLRLLTAIRKFYGKAVQWSKQNLFVRDDFTCQYCGAVLPAQKLTVDHIVPRKRGGKTNWENTVAACGKCNNEKDCKHVSEYRGLRKKPVQPTIMEFARKRIKLLGIDDMLHELGVY